MSERSDSSINRIVALYRRDVDLTLIRENLKKTPEERLLALQELQRFAEELQGARRESRKPS